MVEASILGKSVSYAKMIAVDQVGRTTVKSILKMDVFEGMVVKCNVFSTYKVVEEEG